MRLVNSLVLMLVVTITVIISLGCGGGEPRIPIMPIGDETGRITTPAAAVTDINQWGTWVFQITDAEGDKPASVEAVPIRTGELHVDVKDLLLPPSCTNCLEITLMGVVENDWTLNVELTNPSILTGYDVMGIFPGENGPTVYLPDSYTDLFDVDDDYTTHHPFILYDTGNEENLWGPAESYSHVFTFHRADGQKFSELIYVAAASWPENQAEIVELKNPQITGPLYTDASNPQTITVEVVDHQDDIEYVLIDMSPVNGDSFTNMTDAGEGVYELYNYAEYGLTPGTVNLLIAAKSEGSDYLTYNYLEVEIVTPPPPPTYFELLSGPTELTGDGTPYGEIDLAVVGRTNGSSRTLVHASGTTIFSWNEDYTSSGLFLTLVDTTGGDPNFPIDPLSRIAAADPSDPDSSNTYTILQTNTDNGIWDDTTTPNMLYRQIMQLLDLDQVSVSDFKLSADNDTTAELDAILRPADVSSGVGGDRYGYALWVPDGGEYPGYYPFVSLVRYEPPYVDGPTTYDTLIGGVIEGIGEGKIDADNVNGLAVWDGAGQDELIIIVSEGGSSDEVEIFSANYDLYPETEFTSDTTISGLVGSPLDVAILPVADAGLEDENWVCILTNSKTIEVYTFSGEFIESIFNTDAIPSIPSHIDTDLENLRIHVTMANGPKITVYEYTGM